jgi:hypothetical protein
VYAYVRSSPAFAIDPDGLVDLGTRGVFIGPPAPTGPPDKGMFDRSWTKVHYGFGYAAGVVGMSFPQTLRCAVRWEFWEKKNWPHFAETMGNQIGDIIAAAIGWIDSQGGIPVSRGGAS